jgi:monofunctional biosynthetic peptidoglycan transglycosylase
MGTTDHPFPGPDNPAADADAPLHEPSTGGDVDAAVPAAAGKESDAPLAAEPALDGGARETHAPDVMSAFRCIAAAEPEPAWTSQGFEVFAPPPARVQADESTEQPVEQPVPEAAPSEPDPAALIEPDSDIEVVATVQPQLAEPEPADGAVMSPEPAAFSPAAAESPIETEPPAAIEAAWTPAITDALQAPVEPEPEAAPIPEPDPVAEADAASEPPSKEREPASAAMAEPEAAVHSFAAAQPAVDAGLLAAIEAPPDRSFADAFQSQLKPELQRGPAHEPEPVWTSQGAAALGAVAPPGFAPGAGKRRRWTRDNVRDIGVRAVRVAGIVITAWLCTVLFLIVIYRFVNPPVSALMVLRALTGNSIEQDWVPLRSISPNLRRAVIVSEDGRFCSHWGIDFAEVAAAVKRRQGGVPRGASTITMQVAKNLFLWPAKSYVRKVIEVPLTYVIEMLWPKRRILEVYLNIAEWGPGIFGAEAAARAHFGQSAADLGTRQAAQLAVALPNPLRRNAGAPSAWTSRRASVIQRRAVSMRSASSCVDAAR